MAKVCKDGRIWGQNNKTKQNLGILKDSKYTYVDGKYVKIGFSINSKGSPFKKGYIPWNKGKTGLQPPPWNKGIGRPGLYSYEFLSKLRELIRERDGNKCQLCGMSEADNIRKLDVHHIDYDKSHDDPNNLISLCKSCHSKTQTRRDYWKEKFSCLPLL